MDKCWIVKKRADKDQINQISKDLKINEILANLLCQRGITTFEEAEAFFRPKFSHLHDPFLMKDMDKAIIRIESAINNNEKILIYGDYDVDGTSAVALVYSFFQKIYDPIDFYIPDRDTEGYGVSYKGIDYAYENDYRLIICLDCGIKAMEQIKYAREKGIDFIVGDHHLPGDTIPEAIAILDPKREDCPYPFKELSGCGIGFKLIQAYASKLGKKIEDLTEYLDLVGISIAADIVPITGENRVLAYFGLKLLNAHPRPGIEAILRYSNIFSNGTNKKETESTVSTYFAKELSVSDMVFLVCPRINAAGRIESGRNSVELLLAKTIEEADIIAKEINNYNDERKLFDSLATSEAKHIVESTPAFLSKKSIVVYQPNWHKGVVGIVASRLIEEFYKPTIVFTYSNDFIVGSARSVKEFDIHAAIESCSQYLAHFGGHKYAAGLSLKPENLNLFIEAFEQKVQENILQGSIIPEIEIDDEILLSDITPKFYRILKQFAPFGPENMTPIFKTSRLIDTGFSKVVGVNHLKMSVIQLDERSEIFSGIGFQLGHHLPDIKLGKPFSICYQIEENYWNGKCEKQLNIKDLRFDV